MTGVSIMSTQQQARGALVALTVDDHPLIRSALREVLRAIARQVEVIEAGNPEDGLAVLRARPELDVAFLDLTFSRHDGLKYLRAYRASAPAVPILVYTMHEDAALLRRALCLGAAGIIPKTHSAQLVRKAVELVMDGGVYVPPELVRALAGEADGAEARSPARPSMSSQQWRIVELLAQGLPNKEIGRKLGIAPSTVKNQLTAVFGRLGVSNRTQAAMAAGMLLGSRRLAQQDASGQPGT
jgi:DNA-binding NarL/FixJ family response regulator